jgi:2-phosphosulfolactate phosphatase
MRELQTVKIKRATLDTCSQATGAVVVIDVIRAFTTAAFAFAAGAQDVTLVSTVEDALALRQRMPGALVMGEVAGRPVQGFDLSNSPSALIGADLTGRHLIQRTSAGTQGVVLSTCANTLVAASLCCAGATVRYICKLSPEALAFVITAIGPDDEGDEDTACADYLEALLRSESPEVGPFVQRVRQSSAGRAFGDPVTPEFPAPDLECCVDVDRFNFAMPVIRRNGLLVMEAIRSV